MLYVAGRIQYARSVLKVVHWTKRALVTSKSLPFSDPLASGVRKIGGLILSLLLPLVTPGCTASERPPFQWEPEHFRVKAGYYFQPKAAINNFWNWLDFEQCAKDFSQLREDGFNTILLFIPWGVFQTRINPVTYDELAFARLDRLLRLANDFGLQAGLRIGTHDHVPAGAGGRKWLAATVMTDDREWAAFSDLFREVSARTREHANVLFLFWTFEDAGYTPDLWFHQYPENVSAFQSWLRRRPLWWWNWLWMESNESYQAIEPPNQNRAPLNSMKLRSFLQFSDQITARRLPDACRAAKIGNPEAVVSFQPRAEINWGHDYVLQFELPPCYSFVTTWFSPYQSYMFGDQEKELDGARTASHIPRFLKRIERLSRGLPVFVDQFNFQHFGGHPEEGALGSPEEQLEFVANGLPHLIEHSLGYSLWNYHDYYLNVVNNGSFREGLAEWQVEGGERLVSVAASAPGGLPALELSPGGGIHQQVGVYKDQQYTLSFRARGSRPGDSLKVRIELLPEGDSTERHFLLTREMAAYGLKVKTPARAGYASLSFGPAAGSRKAWLGEVMFYPWVDSGGIYTVEGEPRRELRDLFRRLNKVLPRDAVRVAGKSSP